MIIIYLVFFLDNGLWKKWKWTMEKTRQSVKNVNQRGSTEEVHTNIIDRSGGVLDKYTKHRFLTALVLEIRTLFFFFSYEHAIFLSKFSPFSETHRTCKI